MDKVFLIHNFYQGSFLRFDRTGKLKVPAPVGAWTMGRFEIRQIFLHPSRLDLQGVRVVDVYEKDSPKFAMVPTNSVLAMSVDLPQGELTPKTVMDLLGKVFVHSNADLIRLVPDYWRAYAMKRVQKTEAGYCIEGSRFRSADGQVHDCVSGEVVTDGDAASASEIPFVVGADVHPPQAISTPEPVYNEIAR
ncbi:MAG TPA: hypothetical protein VMU28_11410, partial [Terriglobales bacterium]|nr:hypothetical protein [Terriglobales bacterium]